MTTKVLTGYYDGPGVGYTVGSGFTFSALSITSTGTVLGGHGASGVNGYAGILDSDSGAPIFNSGVIGGGPGVASSNGGYGVDLSSGGYLLNHGTITGGAGGGRGNTGVTFAAGATGSLVNTGLVAGGAGGAGAGSTMGSSAGAGHQGGWGAYITRGSVGNSGTLRGGAGGGGGQGTIGPGGHGGSGGVALELSAGVTLNNTGVIIGGAGGAGGAGQTYGGTGGGGGEGIHAAPVTSLATYITNTGTILGGAGGAGGVGGSYAGGAGVPGVGIYIGSGTVTNGSTSVANAVMGVVFAGVGNPVTVTNFATIQGNSSWPAVDLLSPKDRLVAEAGSTLIGGVYGGDGALELAGGTGTISGLGRIATVSGAVAMTFSTFGYYQLDAGGAWTFTGANNYLSPVKELVANAGLTLAAGASLFIFNGVTRTVPGVVANAGLTLAAGASLVIGNGGTAHVKGVIANAGTIALASIGINTDLRILSAGATLSGGGEVTLSAPRSRVLGSTATSSLTNVDNTIVGRGQIGATDSLTLINLSKGVIDATGTLTVDTSGATLVNDGLMEATTGGTLVVAQTTVNLSGGTIFAAGGVVKLTGADIQGGTLASSGSGLFKAGAGTNTLDGTKTAVALTGQVEVLSGFSFDLVGSIANSGKLALYAGELIVDAVGATLSGGGHVNLSSSTANLITATAAGATLTNVDNTIVGAGTIGGGTLSLDNEVGGLIFNSLAAPLVIDTTGTVINAGDIEAMAAGGGVTVMSAVDNTGHLWAKTGGTLTLNGLVTGSGVGNINGGTLVVADAFVENVSFSGTTGVLELEDSTAYTGFVSGLSGAGTNSLDLRDISFTSGVTTATYSGTTASGTLTVTDGTHTAHIKLAGNYNTSGFTLSSDGNGGTTVIDPAPPPGSAALAQAMATFQIGAPSGHAGTPAWQVPKLPLAHAHG